MGVQPLARAELCFGSPGAGIGLFWYRSVVSCQLAIRLETCQSDTRGEDLCNYVIIVWCFF